MSEPVYNANVNIEWNGADSVAVDTASSIPNIERAEGRIIRERTIIPAVVDIVTERGFAPDKYMNLNPINDYVSDSIANGEIDCSFNVDIPTIAGNKGVIGAIGVDTVGYHAYSKQDTFATPIDRGITVEPANSEYGITNCNPDLNITTPAVWQEHLKAHNEKPADEENKPLSKREMALAFMIQKDNIKIDIKQELNNALKNYPHRAEFIKNLFNTKVMFKEYKHLNFATKRIVLNNILRGKLLVHSANTNDAVNDILVLLENDNHHSTYLHNLRVALSEIISKGIRLV